MAYRNSNSQNVDLREKSCSEPFGLQEKSIGGDPPVPDT